MDKEKYTSVEIEVIVFDVEDVIRTRVFPETDVEHESFD